MMTTRLPFSTSVATLGAMLFLGYQAMAASIVYDNTTSPLGLFYRDAGNGVEYGDEITLAGVDRTITRFKFEYFATNITDNVSFSPNAFGELFIHANDGPLTNTFASPGTVLWQSGLFSVSEGFATVDITAVAVDVPDRFTWSIVFNGLNTAGGDQAGLTLYDPPSIGSSFSDFWSKAGGSWALYDITEGRANFSAQITAVPEPATCLYALMGAVAWLGYRGFRRRQ